MATNTQPTILDHVLMTWSAPARPTHHRGTSWYIIAGSIIAALLVYAVSTRDWSFAMVLIAVAVSFAVIMQHPHPSHTITIGERGFQWDRSFYPWSDCAGYWMLQGPGYTELHIELKNKAKTRMVIQTGDIPIGEIDATLARFLPYLHEGRERLLDYLFRICKL